MVTKMSEDKKLPLWMSGVLGMGAVFSGAYRHSHSTLSTEQTTWLATESGKLHEETIQGLRDLHESLEHKPVQVNLVRAALRGLIISSETALDFGQKCYNAMHSALTDAEARVEKLDAAEALLHRAAKLTAGQHYPKGLWDDVNSYFAGDTEKDDDDE